MMKWRKHLNPVPAVILSLWSLFTFVSPATLNSDVTNLLAAKQTLGDSSNSYLSTWDSNNSVCTWRGTKWTQNGGDLNCSDPIVANNASLARDSGVVVTTLTLGGLGLNGTLPAELGSLNYLSVLNLRENELRGPIPLEIGNSLRLAYVYLSGNQLNDSIPNSIWNLCGSDLAELHLDSNNLTGMVPSPANPSQACFNLRVLDMDNNQLTGSIPSFLGDFASLYDINLSHNLLSGSIPSQLTKLTNLTSFNVAYNNLSGQIPAFKNTYDPTSFVGNSATLCGPPLSTPCTTPTAAPGPAPEPPSGGGRPEGGMGHGPLATGGPNPKLVAGIIIGVLALVFILGSLLIGLTHARSRASRDDKLMLGAEYRTDFEEDASVSETGKIVHFEGGDQLTAEDVLNATGEVLGKTSYGTVYKAKLATGYTIALRLLREGTARDRQEFVPAIQELGQIRHRNLVPLRAYYSGPKEEKLLVYDYMPRGSLADLLHNTSPSKPAPGWARRHKIMLGAARGLAHLHTGQSSPIIHGNLKSKNILVDSNYLAHLSDYGLEKLMIPAATNEVITAASTQGYKAPELLKLKRANMKTDVYSFGIVLLEVLTGKKPGKSQESEEANDLPTLVKTAVLEERTTDLFDYIMIRSSRRTPNEDGLLQALQLAMGCCAPTPMVRPDINEVIRQLEDIRPKVMSSIQSPLYTPDRSSASSREALDY